MVNCKPRLWQGKKEPKRNMDVVKQKVEETSLEAESRKLANFADTEAKLGRRWALSEIPMAEMVTSKIGFLNPMKKEANAKDNEVWLLDNTAYNPVHPYPHSTQPWQAEFVACFFKTGRKDLTNAAGMVLDQIGLDGTLGSNEEVTKRIEERIAPFVSAIAPARTIKVDIPSQAESPVLRTLGPSNSNGISSQIELTGGRDDLDGRVVEVHSHDGVFPSLVSKLRFAKPEGWGIISDIDDTIKITQTPDPIGTLRTTFAEIPKTTPGLPEFYKVLQDQFQNPAWFYLSASPYNLYPFLQKFLGENYPHGTMILRDNSWMYFAGLLQSLTQGVQAYKVDRMVKIHSWLPQRKMICVGDSTQSDPEAYAEIFTKFPGWIHAIFIRKVTDAPFMEEKNKPERFVKAFENVPGGVWKVFENPEELRENVQHLTGNAHPGFKGL